MRISILLNVLLLISGISVQAQHLNESQQVRLMTDLIKTYSPEGQQIVTSLSKLPRKFKINQATITTVGVTKPERWLSGKTAEDIRNSLSTVIHESSHSFTSYYGYQMLTKNPPEDYQFGDDYSAFLISAENIILVKHTEVFNSNELKKDIPKDLRTFRYSPYISPKSNLGSQKQGIYGLLDEFNAYYQGNLMSYNLYPVYQQLAADNPNIYQKYIQNMSSDRLAFYEFKYFILAYLRRAKTEYPAIYRAFLDNAPLREAYKQIHNRYQELMNAHDTRLSELMETLNSQGIESYFEDEYFYVENRGVGMNTGEILILKTELLKPEYISLHNEFLIN
jgi:hypothetical protein